MYFGMRKNISVSKNKAKIGFPRLNNEKFIDDA